MSGPIDFTLNGSLRSVMSDGRPLLIALRDEFGLKAARFGCGQEACGACMVLIDGKPAFSCTREIDTLDGRSITTLEGLADHRLSILVDAFIEEQAGQCGFCLTGILISAAALLDHNPSPSRDEIVAALEPHLCRCGVQNRIVRAVERAARAQAGASGR
jgi:nicotinate dehydrogenase subunit A